MPERADLASGSIWQATVAALRVHFGTLFVIAAPFTLMVSMLLSLYGPPPPLVPADVTLRSTLLLLVLPSLVAAVAKVAVARLVARPAEAPRKALATALALWPAAAAAVLLELALVFVGLVLFFVPGFYIAARLLPLPAVAAEGGTATAMLRRCWDLTEARSGAMMWLLLLGLLFLFGVILFGAYAGAAVNAVAMLAGADAIGNFLATLATAVAGTFGAIAHAAAASVICRRLSSPAG